MIAGIELACRILRLIHAVERRAPFPDAKDDTFLAGRKVNHEL